MLNLRTTPDALRPLLDEKNIRMLTSHKVYTESELRSRYEIQLENYVRTVRIEALTMVDMARKDILPAVVGYCEKLLCSIERKKTVGGAVSCGYETRTAGRLSTLADRIDEAVSVLENTVKTLDSLGDYAAEGDYTRDEVLPKMAERMGVNKSTIIRYESYGVDPKKNYLIVSLAEALQTTPEYITGLSDDKQYDTHTICQKMLDEHVRDYLAVLTSSSLGEPRQELITTFLGELIDLHAVLARHFAIAMDEADRIAEDEGLKESIKRYAIESGDITERAYHNEMAAPIEDMKKLLDLILKLYDKNERNVIGKIYGIKAEARQRLAAKDSTYINPDTLEDD